MADYEISKTFRRSCNFLRVRSSPDASCTNNVIYIIPKEDYEGCVLKVRKEDGLKCPGWIKVDEVRRPNGSKGTSGWVMSEYEELTTVVPKFEKPCPPHDYQLGGAACAGGNRASRGGGVCASAFCSGGVGASGSWTWAYEGFRKRLHNNEESCPSYESQPVQAAYASRSCASRGGGVRASAFGCGGGCGLVPVDLQGTVFGLRSSMSKAENYHRDLKQVVECLKKASNVMVLSGAGMSTAAGIPDFRSPNGLYGTSEQLLRRFTYLSNARESADWQRQQLRADVKNALTHRFFQINPLPYHEMRRGLIIGIGENQWKLTIAHVFPEILNRKGKLRMLASQNIDGLDHRVVSDKKKLYNPHGLMSALMSEPIDECMCMDTAHPIYKKYIELVKANVKDIYADKPTRQGKSCHLWPAPLDSKPITLEMFGNVLPKAFQHAQKAETAKGIFSVKPGSVLFDRRLWQRTAAGETYNVFHDVANCDLLLVMGTSLSGLTIDKMAYIAGEQGKPRAVFDMTTAPVDSIRQKGPWVHGKDCFLQGSLDESMLDILHELGWLDQLFGFLDHLCLASLRTFEKFAASEDIASASMEKIQQAIKREIQREKQFYRDE